MRTYKQQRQFYCGIDLHSRSLYLCLVDHAGNKLLHRELPCEVERLDRVLAQYREGPVVACETTTNRV